MNMSNINVKEKFSCRKVVKVITGLSNLDINDVINRVKAAEISGATYVDIAANPDLVLLVKSITSIPVCVSSINPRDLYSCILAGADMIEIGNFDIFYNKNIIFSFNQIAKIAEETRYLLNNSDICVTIPHHLLLEKQIQLVRTLKNIGINYIQTEGFTTKKQIIKKQNNSLFKHINKSSSALSSSYAIAYAVNIPIIAASGIDALSAPIAISYGASGVAIGSALNNLNNVYAMSNYIKEVVKAISNNNNDIANGKNLKLLSSKKIKPYKGLCFH